VTNSHLAVGAIVRRGSDVLLTREDAEDGEPVWALPGGVVASREAVGIALRRRLAEDTGLFDVQVGPLLWVARYRMERKPFEAFGFEVAAEGSLDIAGHAEWVGLDEALMRLAKMWFAPIRDPALAYLLGRAAVATVWTWPRLDRAPETVPPLDLPADVLAGS
jgi:ADP-ribose pyrophosphatase YjhB (NUDIX family)